LDLKEAMQRREKNHHVKMYKWVRLVRPGGPHTEETYV